MLVSNCENIFHVPYSFYVSFTDFMRDSILFCVIL